MPLALFVGLIIGGWLFLLDESVRRVIEAIGTELVGAKVDLAEADVQLLDGSVRLKGLEVTDPDAPMTNLVQVDEIIADVRILPLLEKKVFVDTVAVRGVQFGTPRATSGALERSSGESGALRRRINAWAERVPIPEFSLEGLASTVDVAAIRPESLHTRRRAEEIVSTADSTRRAFETRLTALNPRPFIDSGRALVDRLSGASLRSLGVTGLVQSVRSLRSTIDGVTGLRDRVVQLENNVRATAASFQDQVRSLEEARAADLANARRLLKIPSLRAPDISPALFGDLALARIQPAIYWVQTAERYLPPGLDPRRRPGPKRARRSGTTMDFPSRRGHAGFTLILGELDVELGGTGAAAGKYRVQVNDFSSAPSIHGKPIRASAERSAGATGPDAVRLTAVIDHVTSTIRDSVSLRLNGVSLPSVSLPVLGAEMDLGRGVIELALGRVGDSLNGRWIWKSNDVSWTRTPDAKRGRVEDILWRTISGLGQVEIEVRVSGRVDGPRLAVGSNVGSAIASSLRRQLRDEIAAAERRVREEVQRLVAPAIADARGRVAALETSVGDVLGDHRVQLDQLRADLESRLRELTRILPPGVRPDLDRD